MANTRLIFNCNSGDEVTLECRLDESAGDRPDEVLITLTDQQGDPLEIYLDKSSAIKFAKTLRTEINKILL